MGDATPLTEDGRCPELRLVWRELDNKKATDQRAIPYCTTHSRYVGIKKVIDDVCFLGAFTKDSNYPSMDYGGCDISIGGPGHKWWADV